MKGPLFCHNLLLKYNQRWLSDFTRLVIRHGLCHQNIQASHQHNLSSLHFPGTGQVTAVAPHALYRLLRGNQPPVMTVTEDMSTRLKQFPVQRVLMNSCSN